MSKRVTYTLQEKVIGSISVSLVFLVMVLLTAEYRALNRTATEVLQLKEEYRSYVMALKRALREKNKESIKDDKSDVKKNEIIDGSSGAAFPAFEPTADLVDSNLPTETFLVVNREQSYLREGALAYAKQHDLDKVLAKMFDSQEWQQQMITRKVVRERRPLKAKRKPLRESSSRVVTYEEPVATGKVDRDFLFSWPIERSKFWISSRFGPRKMGKRAWKFHYGLDMAAPRGTPVQAAAAGIIVESYYHPGFGNCIVILHNHKYKTRYAHLHTRYVKKGEEVARGKVIGTVGATGHVLSRGNDASHLHFEVYTYGRRVNPLSVLI